MTGEHSERDRVVTVPNALSVLRLILIPVFLYVLLVEKADGWAFAILMVSGFSDWLDGKLARLLDQSSSIGALLDPLADRIYIIAIPLAFGVREIIPWWLIGIIVARDVLLALQVPLLRSRGVVALPVLYIGKAATFALMSAFPWILLGQLDTVVGRIALPFGWALLIWGVALYLWTFVLYWYQTILLLRSDVGRVQPNPDAPPASAPDTVIADEGKASG
ncbi:putative phosphatidylglycerophosphate synthase [Gordonia araii NBRC 100433]|uniref:Putative phosphatidylglycerophosphate synthase n=1 Tax=Gordonia araii NBRC 100433 TaxID=1073574 RepID=G7H0Q8_9ACTN|nr:CDP-alcohol phosphatidyltransferase family protein [Gordonia araii]NNG96804.1 CDP-alcohol phosphatidyltransferase family protein [Gordonia araii NBRC 100433]GAB09433.1 putative phosphatidylglycerophosphate synthase [Gordonia araii NBRC 100433]